MREQSAGIRKQPGWRAESRDGAGSTRASCLPFSSGLAQQGVPEWVWGESEVLLSPLEMLLYNNSIDKNGKRGGQIQEGKGVSSVPPYSLPFSPTPLLPLWAKPLYLGHEGDAQRVQGLSEDVVEPKQGLHAQAE